MKVLEYRFYLRPGVSKAGESLVYLDVKAQGGRQRVSTGVKIKPENWNERGSSDSMNWVKTSHPLHKEYNALLLSIAQKITIIKLKAIQDGVHYTAAEVVHMLFKVSPLPTPQKRQKAETEEEKNFLAYAHHVVNIKTNIVSESRIRQMKGAILKLQHYHGHHYLKWSAITPDLFQGFMSHLAGQGLKPNSVNAVLKVMGVVLTSAIANKLLPPGQYLPKGVQSNIRTQKEKLTIEQIEKLATMTIPLDASYYHARNLFLFCFYLAGTRISDVLSLTWSQIQDGKVVIDQLKTGKRLTIPLVPKAVEILAEYRTDKSRPDDYVFPYLEAKPDRTTRKGKAHLNTIISTSTSRYNKQLKALAKEAGICITLTSHVARHTFASVAATKGANLHQLSKSLGHTSLRTTEIYLKDIDPEAVDAVLRMME